MMIRCLAFLIFIVAQGCKPAALDVSEYLKWINDSRNGVTISKQINDVELKVRYMSPEWRVYLHQVSDGKAPSIKEKDSILTKFRSQVSFLLTISPSTTLDGDIMLKDVISYEDYKTRMEIMNFHLRDFIELRIGNEIIKPLATSFENTYGLTKYRNVIIVFSKDQLRNPHQDFCGWLDLVFDDQILNTGISHFAFNMEVIKNTPKLNLNI